MTIATLRLSGATRAVSVQPLPPVTEADGRFGLCDVLPGTTPSGLAWAQLAANAGARVNRWEFRWDHMEPKRGVWGFSANDAAVASSRLAGLAMEGILIGTPKWAAAHGQRPGNGVPKGLYRAPTDPRNIWADYVRQTVVHYRGQVRWWEIWNEPDLQFFWMGTPADYLQLLKVSYQVIRESDPSAKVMIAGMVVPGLAFLRSVLDLDVADSGAATVRGNFDIAAWHAYGPARDVYTNLQHLHELLASHGFSGTPVWVTEGGFPASNPNGEARQAEYVVQTAAYALAAGAAKILVYRASDDALPKTWGLQNATGGFRLGYVTYQAVARYLSHVQALTYKPTGSIERFVFYEPNRRVTLLWNRAVTDRHTALAAYHPDVALIDWTGASSPSAVVNGRVPITVPGAAYNVGIDPGGSVVGGPSIFGIEDNSTPHDTPVRVYATAVPGTNRRLALFNASGAAVNFDVVASAAAHRHVAGQLAGHAVYLLDLDLIAGSKYHGGFTIASSGPIANEAVSTDATVQANLPAASWYLAASPPGLTVHDTETSPAEVDITGYDAAGHVKVHSVVKVAPRGTATWSVPAIWLAEKLSTVVRSTTPIVIQPPIGATIGAVSRPRSRWYVLRPRQRRLTLFNSGSSSALVDIQFTGSSEIAGEQVHVATKHSFTFETGSAKTVAIQSSRSLVVGYSTSSDAPSLTGSQPSTQAGLAVAGTTTRVDLFNPSAIPAHVTLSVTTAGSLKRTAVQLLPSNISTVSVRATSGPPSGVVVTSDIPIVAAVR